MKATEKVDFVRLAYLLLSDIYMAYNYAVIFIRHVNYTLRDANTVHM